MSELLIRPREPEEDAWARSLLEGRWGSHMIATQSGLHDGSAIDGFVAQLGVGADVERVGLVTYRVEGDACEVTSLDSLRSGLGIGTQLLDAVADVARSRGCSRLWLITTNDNLAAIRFYQRRGWDLVALYRDSVTHARETVKPQIPLIGREGIPLRHELELELRL